MSSDESVIEFGSFRLNRLERSLASADGAPIQLTRRLYDTLLFMVERPGRLLEKQALLDAVWKGAVVEENTLSRTISALRQILGERAGEHRYIETVSGVGYRFLQSVTVTEVPASQTASARRHEPSIAVLPFEDLSRERDQGYFADGIAEEVLNRLAGMPGLRVTAKSSSFRLRERADGAQAIGRRLGVDYLLVGAVRKEGERVRVTAQLIEAESESQRWSERFDRELDLEHIFAIQDDIARAVATALSATLGVGGAPTATRDLEAYELYLRGRSVADQSGARGMIRSAELYREAVSHDPGFAAAWLSLAGVSRGRLIFAPPEHAASAVKDIEEAVARLLELAPRWWATHMAQSWPLHLRRDWLGMQRALDRARELAPGIPWELSLNLGVFHAQMNSRAAIEHYRAAARSDPLSLMTSGLLQRELIVAGRDDEAQSEYRRSLDLAGDREMAEHLQLHRLWAQGAPFREQFRRYLDLTQTKPAPVLEEVYAVCDEPRLALDKLRSAAAAPEYQSPPRQLVLAWWLASYGDVDAAFAAIWRGYVDLRYLNVSWLWFPVLAPAREHARFPELLERVGLADYWQEKGQVLSTS